MDAELQDEIGRLSPNARKYVYGLEMACDALDELVNLLRRDILIAQTERDGWRQRAENLAPRRSMP